MSQPFMCDNCGQTAERMTLKLEWRRWNMTGESWDFCSHSCLFAFVAADDRIYPKFPRGDVLSVAEGA